MHIYAKITLCRNYNNRKDSRVTLISLRQFTVLETHISFDRHFYYVQSQSRVMDNPILGYAPSLEEEEE